MSPSSRQVRSPGLHRTARRGGDRHAAHHVKVIEGVFSDAQKRQIIQRLTDAMVAVEGENLRQVTWVVVQEVHSGDWGIAGQPLTTTDVNALAAGTPVG